MNEEFLKIVRASAERKKKADLRLGFYHDQQHDDLLALIRQNWSDPEEWRLFHVNIVKKTVNRRSMVYRISPVRSFTGMDQETGESLYQSIRADTLLKTANRMVKLLKSCALQVGWDQETKAPKISILTPNILDVIGEDPRRPTRVIVTNLAARAEDVTYSDWSATKFSKVDSRGRHLIPVCID